MKTLSFASACLIVLAATSAEAQVRHEPYMPRPGYPAAEIYVNGPHHASTAAESYARGYADVVRAQGQYKLLASQALVNLAEVRRREIENRTAQTDAYFQMRETNRRYRSADRTTRQSQYSVTSHRAAKQPVNGSNPERIDMRNGRLAWPKALQDDGFEVNRTVVERILESQTSLGTLSDLDRSTLIQNSRAMASQLQDRIGEYSAADYMAAKRFLEALSQHPGTLG